MKVYLSFLWCVFLLVLLLGECHLDFFSIYLVSVLFFFLGSSMTLWIIRCPFKTKSADSDSDCLKLEDWRRK